MKIPLSKGAFALVSPQDYDKLIKMGKWSLHSRGYAVRTVVVKGKQQPIYMHRVINNTPSGWITDHINRDKLDNRRENLRTANTTLNNYNSKKDKLYEISQGNPSRFLVRVRCLGQRLYVGYFGEKQEARQAHMMVRDQLEASLAIPMSAFDKITLIDKENIW